MKKIMLKIEGMTCSACSSSLEKFLNKQEEINSASVNLLLNYAEVQYDETKIDMKGIENYVSKIGFKSAGIYQYNSDEKKEKRHTISFVILAIISVFILYISMGDMIGLPSIPGLSMHHNTVNFSLILCILSTLVVILCREILINGVKKIFHRAPNMDSLIFMGVASGYIYSIYIMVSILMGNYHQVENLYFESSAIVLFFVTIGRYIDKKSKIKTKQAISDLMTITPNSAVVIRNEKKINVTIDEIQKGDIVVCKPGEKVAVDGVIVNGSTHIDESFITGESAPASKRQGNRVLAGSINVDGYIEYEAQRIGKDSTISEIVRIVVEATNSKTPMTRLADKISGIFVPFIISLAVLSFILWLILGANFAYSINIFITVLVIACPCALGLATPLAIVVSEGVCAKKGILVKKSEVLENAHKINTIVFDKTGTLTQGKLRIAKWIDYTDMDRNEGLKLVGSIESKSEHPIAKAILNECKEKNIELEEVEDFSAILGMGVKGKINGLEILVGNLKLMKEYNIQIKNEEDEERLVIQGNTILYVAKNGQLVSLIGIKDILKDNVKEVIEELKDLNIDVIMLTGDHEKTARVIADEIGITHVIANVMPKDKKEVIDSLKKENKLVMMCGDGINDAPSLVSADIGVSIETGTDIAMDSSDVILMKNDLAKILDLLKISKKTVRKIKQNLFWAFFYNLCMLPIAIGILKPFGILLNPMMASIAMILSSFTVIINSLMIKRKI